MTSMRDYSVYMWVGAWLLLLPFLGIPGSWKNTLMMLTAFGFIAYALILIRRGHLKQIQDSNGDTSQEDTVSERSSQNISSHVSSDGEREK